MLAHRPAARPAGRRRRRPRPPGADSVPRACAGTGRTAAAVLGARAPHGAQAGITIWWSNWCAPGNPGGGNLSPPPTGLELILPQGGSVRLKVTGAPRCDAPSEPSRLAVGSFQPLVPQPPASTRLPLRLRFDRTAYRVTAGTTLHYQVTVMVTSTARRPFRFRSCPIYFEQLGGSRPYELHYLNCRPVGTLAPGGSAVFAIELRVPPRTRPGRFGLLFELGLGTYQPVQTPAPPVLVTR
jgi:hypothetical protein